MACLPNSILVRFFSTAKVATQMVKPPIQVFGTDGLYATALYSAASKKKSLDAVEKDLNNFAGLMRTDAILKEFLMNPLLDKSLKLEAISSVATKKKLSPLTVNLLSCMAENGCLNKIGGISDAFNTIMAAERGEVVCEVTTAKTLDAAMMKEVEATLKSFLKKGETIKLNTKVDPSIIGGMLVSIGDKYVDMSIATKISKYTELIQQAA